MLPDFYVVRDDGRPVPDGWELIDAGGHAWTLLEVATPRTIIAAPPVGSAVEVDPATFGVRIYGHVPGDVESVWPPLDETADPIRPRFRNGGALLLGGTARAYTLERVEGDTTGKWRRVRYYGDWLHERPTMHTACALACWHNARQSKGAPP